MRRAVYGIAAVLLASKPASADEPMTEGRVADVSVRGGGFAADYPDASTGLAYGVAAHVWVEPWLRIGAYFERLSVTASSEGTVSPGVDRVERGTVLRVS